MPGHTRLHNRNGTYYLRAKVPRDVRSIIGKGEIQRSLRTKSYREALRLIKLHSIRVDQEFEDARTQLKREARRAEKPLLGKLSEEEIFSIVFECFIKKERDNESWFSIEAKTLLEERRSEMAEALGDHLSGIEGITDAVPDYWAAKELLEPFLSARGLRLDEKSRDHIRLLEFATQAYEETTNRLIDRLEQGGHFNQRVAAFEGLTAQSNLPSLEKRKSVRLGEFLQEYESTKRESKSAATVKAISLPLRVLREVIGEEKPLRTITREDLYEVAQALRSIPVNMAQRYPGLSIMEGIKRGQRDQLPTRSQTTLANNWIHVLSVFNYAKDDGLIDENPAQSRRTSELFRKSKRSTRRPFSLDELKKVFRSAFYTERSSSGELIGRHKDPALFWLPLLGLFQGGRLNELCQLELADVKEEDGVPYLFIREESESGGESLKSLKTDESRRKLPLHPMLLKAGFLGHVKECRESGKARLFSDLKHDHNSGRFGGGFSKRFARQVRKTAGENTKATFHSLRHNFRDALRRAEIPPETTAVLGGWRFSGGSMDLYGDGLDLVQLRDAIAKVEYPGLDLTHLSR